MHHTTRSGEDRKHQKLLRKIEEEEKGKPRDAASARQGLFSSSSPTAGGLSIPHHRHRNQCQFQECVLFFCNLHCLPFDSLPFPSVENSSHTNKALEDGSSAEFPKVSPLVMEVEQELGFGDLENGRASCGKEGRSRWSPYH